jgi:16S rRNA (cytosine1402-N4)-methyltransferase
VVSIVTERAKNQVPAVAGHLPVMLQDALEYLSVRPGGRYIDATFGGGGHTAAILERSAPNGQLLALDADPLAIERAQPLVERSEGRLIIRHTNFANIAEIAHETGFAPVDGVLFDLGLSSYQFDERERGFSLHSSARLDMRLDPATEEPTAWDIVNTWDERDVADVIYRYGEESRSRRIARAIVERRTERAIETNLELTEIVERALGGRRGARIHPATKTFQGIRIAVNRELESLQSGLAGALECLRPGGRLVVISFHSLEDRIVKQFMQHEARDCICPPEVPVCQCDHRARLAVITRKPVRPREAEVEQNPRSRSARLRASERIA